MPELFHKRFRDFIFIQLLCILGLLHSLSFTSALPGVFNFLSLLVLWIVIVRSSTASALSATALFYSSHFIASLSWLFVYASSFGKADALPSSAFLALLSAYFSLFYIFATFAFKKISAHARRRKINIPDGFDLILILPTLWLISDYARSKIFPVFPWVLAGYGYDSTDWIIQLTQLSMFIPIGGVLGFGFMVYVLTGFGVFLYFHISKMRCNATAYSINEIYSTTSSIILIICFAWFLRFIAKSTQDLPQPILFSQPVNESLSVALLQDHVRPDENFFKSGITTTEIDSAFEYYGKLIRNEKSDLLVLPETLLPLPWDLASEKSKNLFLKDKVADWILLGSVMQSRKSESLPGQHMVLPSFTNSAIGIKDDIAHEYRYDKSQMIPIAEYMPTGWSWLVEWIKVPHGNFDRGSLEQTPLTIKNNEILPSICYEFLFGDLFSQRLRNHSGNSGLIFINLSNLAWFGDGIVLDHVHRIIAMREMEFEIPFLMSSKTGPSTPSSLVQIDHKNKMADSNLKCNTHWVNG